MERYLKITKPASLRATEKKDTPHGKKPYDRRNRNSVTKHLLSSLSNQKNPITHSDIYSRTKHIVSASTGHQVQDGRIDKRAYVQERTSRLQEQNSAIEESTLLFSGVRAWVDQHLESTVAIEVRKLISLHGGEIRTTVSEATHILSSSTSRSNLATGPTAKVVRAEWVLDSVAAGKRKTESEYAVKLRRGCINGAGRGEVVDET